MTKDININNISEIKSVFQNTTSENLKQLYKQINDNSYDN